MPYDLLVLAFETFMSNDRASRSGGLTSDLASFLDVSEKRINLLFQALDTGEKSDTFASLVEGISFLLDSLEETRKVNNQSRTIVFLGENGIGKSFILNLLLMLSCPPSHSYEAQGRGRLNYVRELRERLAETHEVFSPLELGERFRTAFHPEGDARETPYKECAQRAWVQCLSTIEAYGRARSDDQRDAGTVQAFLLPSQDGGVSCTSSNIVLQYGEVPCLEFRYLSEPEVQALAFSAVNPSSKIDERQDAKRAYVALVGQEPGKRGEKDPKDVILKPEVLNLIRGRKRMFTGQGLCLWEDMIFIRDALQDTHNHEFIRYVISKTKVSVPSSLLANGEKIVDTPGTNDADPFNSEHTRVAVEKATDVFVITKRGLNNNVNLRSVISDHSTLLSRLLDERDRLRVRVVHYFEATSRPSALEVVNGLKPRLASKVTTALNDSVEAMTRVLTGAIEQRMRDEAESGGRRGGVPLTDAEIEERARSIMSKKVVFRDIWPALFASRMLDLDFYQSCKPDFLEEFARKSNGLWLFGCVMAERHAVCEAEAGKLRESLREALNLVEKIRTEFIPQGVSEEVRRKARRFVSNNEVVALNAEGHCRDWGNLPMNEFFENVYEDNVDACKQVCLDGLSSRISSFFDSLRESSSVRPETPFNANYGGIYKTKSGEVFDLLDTVFHGFISPELLAHLSDILEEFFLERMDQIFRSKVMNLIHTLEESVLGQQIEPEMVSFWFEQFALPRFRHIVTQASGQTRLQPKSLAFQGKKITRQSLKATALRQAERVTISGSRAEKLDALEQMVREEAGPSAAGRRRKNSIDHASDALKRYMEDRAREAFKQVKGKLSGLKRTDMPITLMKSFLRFICSSEERLNVPRREMPADVAEISNVLDSLDHDLEMVLKSNRQYATRPEESGRRMLNHLRETRVDFQLLHLIRRSRQATGTHPKSSLFLIGGKGDLVTALKKDDPKHSFFFDKDGIFKSSAATAQNQISQLQTLLRSRYGLEIVDVEGDNRCLFRVFEHSRTGNATAPAQDVDLRRRRLCRKFLEVFDAPEQRNLFFETYGETVAQYAERMMNPNEWGDHLMIEMHARYSEVCVVVWIPGKDRPMIFGDETKPECHIVWGSLQDGDSRNHYMSTRLITAQTPKNARTGSEGPRLSKSRPPVLHLEIVEPPSLKQASIPKSMPVLKNSVSLSSLPGKTSPTKKKTASPKKKSSSRKQEREENMDDRKDAKKDSSKRSKK